MREFLLGERWRAYTLLTGKSVLEVEFCSCERAEVLTQLLKPREALTPLET